MSGGNIGTLLKSDKVPFFLSALFAALSWALVHIVGSVLATPIIEYRPLSQEIPKGLHLTPCEPTGQPVSKESRISGFEVTNISRVRLFKALKFVIVSSGGHGEIQTADLISLAPIHLDRDAEQATCDPQSAEFPIPELHPGWKCWLVVRITGDYQPELRFAAHSQAVRLQQPSVETFFV